MTTSTEIIRHWGSATHQFAWLVLTRSHGTVQVASASAHALSWDDHHDWGVPPETAALIRAEVLQVHQDFATGHEVSIPATHTLESIGGITRFTPIGDPQ